MRERREGEISLEGPIRMVDVERTCWMPVWVRGSSVVPV